MKRLFAILALALVLTIILLWLAIPARADTLYLPIIRGGYVVTVTGVARWEGDFGPVAHRWFALLEVICENPPVFRHNSDSPHARTDAQGRFVFEGVKDGQYILAVEDRPPFWWNPVWPPDEAAMVLVVVEEHSVEMGTVRIPVTHSWGE